MIKHSKYRNVGILYELLSQQMTADFIAMKKTSPALNIIREYWGKKSQIRSEFLLHNALFSETVQSESRAQKMLDLVLEQRIKLNEEKLNREKYKLISEIKKNYDLNKFFSYNLPSYPDHAAIYKVFQYNLVENIKDPSDYIKSETRILENLQTKKDKRSALQLNESKEMDKDLRILSHRIFVEKFNQKYSKTLNENQASLIKKYIYSLDNGNDLKEYVISEIPKIKKSIGQWSKLITDKTTQIKLNEVTQILDGLITKRSRITTEDILTLMKYYQLLEEMNKLQKS